MAMMVSIMMKLMLMIVMKRADLKRLIKVNVTSINVIDGVDNVDVIPKINFRFFE